MSETIAEKLESYDLQGFRNDLRRALLMHRKGRLTLFFRLHFPMADAAGPTHRTPLHRCMADAFMLEPD